MNVKIEKIETAGHIINIDGKVVEYSRIPSRLIPETNGITFYIKTTYITDKLIHDTLVSKIIKLLISQNETDYTSWELVKSETLIWRHIDQVTVVSFRTRDIY